MQTIYLDWNIINAHPQNDELCRLLKESREDKYITIFSNEHMYEMLRGLKVSPEGEQKSWVIEGLYKISEFCNGYYNTEGNIIRDINASKLVEICFDIQELKCALNTKATKNVFNYVKNTIYKKQMRLLCKQKNFNFKDIYQEVSLQEGHYYESLRKLNLMTIKSAFIFITKSDKFPKTKNIDDINSILMNETSGIFDLKLMNKEVIKILDNHKYNSFHKFQEASENLLFNLLGLYRDKNIDKIDGIFSDYIHSMYAYNFNIFITRDKNLANRLNQVNIQLGLQDPIILTEKEAITYLKK